MDRSLCERCDGIHTVRRVLHEGGYEGGGAMLYYGLPSAWDSMVEQTIVEEVLRQLR